MGAIASQITGLTIVYSTVYSYADQRKHHSSASLGFVWGIHRGPVNSLHKWPATRKMFPFDDIIMNHAMENTWSMWMHEKLQKCKHWYLNPKKIINRLSGNGKGNAFKIGIPETGSFTDGHTLIVNSVYLNESFVIAKYLYLKKPCFAALQAMTSNGLKISQGPFQKLIKTDFCGLWVFDAFIIYTVVTFSKSLKHILISTWLPRPITKTAEYKLQTDCKVRFILYYMGIISCDFSVLQRNGRWCFDNYRHAWNSLTVNDMTNFTWLTILH